MGDMIEAFRDLTALRQIEGERSRNSASRDFEACQRIAVASGLKLNRKSADHYQLHGPGHRGWLINVYPGNHRLWMDKNRPAAPFLHVRRGEWTLREVINAAIAAGKAVS